MTQPSVAPAQGTQMIDRTVSLMRLVATYRPDGARLTDLAEEAGLPAPTARRILKRLVDHGLITQDRSKHRYKLGRLAAEFGLSHGPVSAEVSRHRSLLDALAKATGETCYLLMRSGLDSICIDKIEAGGAGDLVRLRVGDRLPLGAGVGGMALLAALPDEEAERIIAANQPVYRRFTRTTGSSFRDHLAAARACGHVVRRSPVTPGIVGFGMALPEVPGDAAIAVSGATLAKNFVEPRRTRVLTLLEELVSRHVAGLRRAAA